MSAGTGAGFCAELELGQQLRRTLAWKIPWPDGPEVGCSPWGH